MRLFISREEGKGKFIEEITEFSYDATAKTLVFKDRDKETYEISNQNLSKEYPAAFVAFEFPTALISVITKIFHEIYEIKYEGPPVGYGKYIGYRKEKPEDKSNG